MGKLGRAFGMCQSMFCAIPCPYHGWDEDARSWMLLFLPVIGAEIGLVWALALRICIYFELSRYVAGAVLAVLPGLLTGGMHLDGFLDVQDALGSYRPLERRREVLKDSHVGAFAVIGCVWLYLGLYGCGCAAPDVLQAPYCAVLLGCIPVVSRCGSALAVTCLRSMETSQYAAQHISHTQRRLICAVAIAVFLGLAAMALYLGRTHGSWCGVCLWIEAGVYALALRHAYKGLDGMNGDVAGYAMCVSELGGLAALCIAR